MSADTAEVSDTDYAELTARQQAIIDELARDRINGEDRLHSDIVVAAADGEDFHPPHETNVTKTRDKYPELIDERVDALLNGDRDADAGANTVEGVNELLDDDEDDWQTWDERPNKDVARVDVVDGEETVEGAFDDFEPVPADETGGTTDATGTTGTRYGPQAAETPPDGAANGATDEDVVQVELDAEDALTLLSRESVPISIRRQVFDSARGA